MNLLKNSCAIFCCFVLAVATAHARDDKNMYSIEKAMVAAAKENKLNKDIKFYFGSQSPPKVTTSIETTTTSRKTNAFGKSDEDACNWAFLSALIALQERAAKVGGNAITNLRSNYKNIEVSSDTEYECGTGAIMAGVAFKGEIVKLEK